MLSKISLAWDIWQLITLLSLHTAYVHLRDNMNKPIKVPQLSLKNINCYYCDARKKEKSFHLLKGDFRNPIFKEKSRMDYEPLLKSAPGDYYCRCMSQARIASLTSSTLLQ